MQEKRRNSMIFEALIGFRECNRYHAHSKIDETFKHLLRGQARSWHYSIIQTQPDAFVGVMRTRDQRVVDAMPQAKWKELVVQEAGEHSGVCLIEYMPKHVTTYEAFRDDSFAKSQFVARDQVALALENVTCELVSRTMVDISKKGCSYHGPAAWFEVSGTIKSKEEFQKLILQGTGGSRAFGIGLLNPPNSQLYSMAQAVSEAKRDI
jgi:hypothetical protein